MINHFLINNKTIIQKTVIDLQYNGGEDAFVLQREFSDWCNLKLLPGLEERLEKLDTKNTHTRIDNLELEIVIDDKKDWQGGLLEKVLESLKKELSTSLLNKNQEQGISHQSNEQHFFDAFVFFLQNGWQPWWSGIKSSSEFSSEFSNWIKNGLNNAMKDQLYELSFENRVQQRIARELSHEEFVALISELYDTKKSEIELIFEDATTFITGLLPEKRRFAETEFKKLLWQNTSRIDKAEALQLSVENFSTMMAGQARISSELTSQLRSSFFKAALDIKHTAKPKQEEDKVSNEGKRMIKDNYELLNREGIYINNAGLVIIAPFLSLFFKKLNLMQDDQLTEIEKAVCLVHYLATGEESAAEFELGLIKIVCGLKMEAPVGAMMDITDLDKHESNELLLSVIEYWTVLKNTSVQGLRESFLQRNGKLTFHNNEWLLQVEQKPYDMLLESLPWNISLIKMPWMPYILKTEWIK